jgi:filamentous hemagglutinin
MNKLRYRIVFNKARGMCMAVQETARSQGKSSGQSGPLDASDAASASMARSLLVGAALGGALLAQQAPAQIVADPSAAGQQRATVLNAANGVLQVNVQTPSAAGVSRNVYTQFDVPKSGAVLNNSRASVQTQLGGWVQANPWLATGTARVILNEVNSNNPSRLQGYIEVAGQRAETVIANPAGISVDGGGFINVSRATLTTGVPLMQDGQLKGYDVQRGQISIEGAGLDASRTDYTALISRSVQVNAGLWAQRLSVLTGANVVDAAETGSTPPAQAQPGDGPAPRYAIDVASLGGMYANQIYLVGTETGVGVRNAGEIGAAAGELVVTSEGRLENRGSLSASQKMQLTAGSVENRGNIAASGALSLSAGELLNAGRIASAGQAVIGLQNNIDNRGGSIEARSLELSSAGGVLLNSGGTIVQTGSAALNIDGNRVLNVNGVLGQAVADSGGGAAPGAGSGTGSNAGTGVPDGTAPAAGGGSPEAGSGAGNSPGFPSGGTPVAGVPEPVFSDGHVRAGQVDNQNGLITASGGINLTTAELDNHGGQLNLNSLAVRGAAFDNSRGNVNIQQTFQAQTDAFTNQDGKLLVGGRFDAQLGQFSNRGGLVQAGHLQVDVAGNLDNGGGTLRQTGNGKTSLTIGGEFIQDNGTLELASSLALKAGEISGSGGALRVAGDFELQSGNTSARQGAWSVDGNAQLHSGDFDGSGGAISVGGQLVMESGALNSRDGKIASVGKATIGASGLLDNSNGHIQAGADLTVRAYGALQNTGGTVESLAGGLAVSAASIDNTAGHISNAGGAGTVLQAGSIINSGLIGSNGGLLINAATLSNAVSGTVLSGGDLTFAVSAALENAGRINSAGQLLFEQQGAHLRNSGSMVSYGALRIDNGSVDNTGGTLATASGGHGQMTIHSGKLVNDAGSIAADGGTELASVGGISNIGGKITAATELVATAGGRIDNAAGAIEAGRTIQVRASDLANQAGRIAAAGVGPSLVDVVNLIDNDGLIGANGALTVNAVTLNNGARATISSGTSLQFGITGAMNNTGGAVSSGGTLTFEQPGATLSNAGMIASAGNATLHLAALRNDGGSISTVGGASLALEAGALSNRNGAIMSSGDAVMTIAGQLDNAAGTVQATRSLTATAGGALNNQGGVIEVLGAIDTLAIRAGSIDNSSGRIVNTGTGSADVAADAQIVNSGLIGGNGQLSVTAQSLQNQAGGTISSGKAMELAVSSVLDNAGTISAAAAMHAGQANALIRNSGTMVANGMLDLSAASINNDGGRMATAQGSNADLLLNAQNISNQAGAVMADRNATVSASGALNNRGGLLQARSDLALSAGGTLDNAVGDIESLSATSAMRIQAGSLTNEAGHIVNLGAGATNVHAASTLSNGGLISAARALAVEAAQLENGGNGIIAAGGALALLAHDSLSNAGKISSKGSIVLDEAAASVTNTGSIVAGANSTLHAAMIDNDGGQIAAAAGSGASLALQAGSLSNRAGQIVAENSLSLAVDGGLDNSLGTIQGLNSVDAAVGGTLTNSGGVIEASAAQATLHIQANALANAAGRIVNVGTGMTSIAADTTLSNSGLIAGNGALQVSAADLDNQVGGTISAGSALTATVAHSLTNAGRMSAQQGYTLSAAGAAVRNNGQIVSGGNASIQAGDFNNDGGQVVTVKDGGGSIVLQAVGISNVGGTMLADSAATITASAGLDNKQGVVRARDTLGITAGGTLANQGGTIEVSSATATLAVQAAAIDNGSGHIVNAGNGATQVHADGSISNSGLIGGNGALTLSAAVLSNAAGGTVSAGAALDLQLTQQLDNAGTLSAAGSLTMDEVAASIRNSGQVVAGGAIALHAAAISNDGGTLATSAAGGANIAIDSAGGLSNRGGTIVSAGTATLHAAGAYDNSQGLVRASALLKVNSGGALVNDGGALETSGTAGVLDVAALSISNAGGRMVNAGAGLTTIDSQTSILNSGTIAGNGAVELRGATLQNATGGVVSAGQALELAIRQQLDNRGGYIGSAGTLNFNQTVATFSNSGEIGAAGPINIVAAAIVNDGGQLYTAKNTGAAITLQSASLSNSGGTVAADGRLDGVFSASVGNSGGSIHAGGDLSLQVGGALDNGSGTIEAAGSSQALTVQAASVSSSGRIVNAGSGKTTISSGSAIVNSGLIAGNGALDLHAATLQNQASGQIGSGRDLMLDIRQALANQGSVSSGGTLTFDQAGASFSNSGNIASAGKASFVAASFNNNGGKISTVKASGADVSVTAASLSNQSGAILADGSASFAVAGAVDNSQGTLQAGGGLQLASGGTLTNNAGVIEAIGGASSLSIDSLSIANGSGRISNVGSGSTRLLSKGAISNTGTIAAMGDLLLSGTTLQNQAGGTVASGRNLDLAITQQLSNQGKVNSSGTLTFNQAGASFINSGQVLSGGNAVIVAQLVNNDGGQLGTSAGSGASLTLTSQQLSNQGGRIGTDGDLLVNTHAVNAIGELFAGRDLGLSMDGDYVQGGAGQQIHSNRDLSLAVTGTITNTGVLESAGKLSLSGNQLLNQAGAVIQGQALDLKASGAFSNAGEINGTGAVDLTGDNLSNSGAIVGGSLTVHAQNLDNNGAAALLGATTALNLVVSGTLNNTAGATIYSSGDLAIGGAGGATGLVNNNSSTIEAGGNLALNAGTLTNVRENVQVVQVETLNETRHMTMPSWYHHGDNHNSFELSAANYHPHEVYFVNPDDILEETNYVTPDGYNIVRAVIRTHANDSAFLVGGSGLYGAYGIQERIPTGDGTRVIYYTERAQVANPDQGGSANNALVHVESVTNWSSTLSYSNQYGSCSSNCIRLVTVPDYTDPTTTIWRDQLKALAPVKEKLEVSRDAHHVVVEDQLAPGAGAAAQILSGGDMHLTVSNVLANQYGDIKARGSLVIDGGAAISNQGATLYRTHTFDGTWRTEAGDVTAYQHPSISEVIGSAAGTIQGGQGVSISGRSFSNIDVTAGSVGNIRDAVQVIGSGASGAASAGSQATAGGGGKATAGVNASTGANNGYGTLGSIGTSVAGGGITTNAPAGGSGFSNGAALSGDAHGGGTGNQLAASGAAGGSGKSNQGVLLGTVNTGGAGVALGNVGTTGGGAIGQAAGGVQGAAVGKVVQVTASGLFVRNPDSQGAYLFETRSQFANKGQWTSSDYLLNQLALDPATTQKRLGDGFYEQRMVREQLSELTGHSPTGGASDDAVYKQLLNDAVSFAQEFGLRPGVTLSAEQVSHLTSDIVWMESQTVMLPDGSTDTVLVPKVYLAHVGEQALQPGGALVTGNGVKIDTTDSIVNKGGVIDGGSGRTLLLAGQDIVNQGGTIQGGAVALGAGRDVKNESLAVKESYASSNNSGSYTSLSNQATIATTGTLEIAAGRNIADLAGKITAGSADIGAVGNISFNTIKTGSTYQSQISGYTENDSSVTHQLSQISTSGDLNLRAGGNLSLTGTQMSIGTSGTGAGKLLAGGGISISAVTNEVNTSVQNDPSSKQYDKQVHQNQTVVGAGVAAAGDLTLAAGLNGKADLNLTASVIAAGGNVVLSASNDVHITNAMENHVSDTAIHRESSGLLKSSSSTSTDYSASAQVVGSSVSGNGVTVRAGNDIAISGSQVTAEEALKLNAGRDLNVISVASTGSENHTHDEKSSGFSFGAGGVGYSKSTQTQAGNSDTVTQVGSVLSGGSVSAASGRDTLVQGSTVVADNGIRIDAGRDLAIVSAENSKSEESSSSSKKSGSIGSMFQPAIGTVKTTQDGTRDEVSQVGSQIASLGGSVTLNAGNKYTQTASEVTAQTGNIAIAAKDVLINAGVDSGSSTEHSTFSKTAIGGSVNIPVVSAVQSVVGMVGAAKDSGDSRMQALAAMNAVKGAMDAASSAQAMMAGSASGIKVSVSLGNSKSDNKTEQHYETAVGSTIAAGGNVSIIATGGGADSNLTAIGSDISAGKGVTLGADNDVTLMAAKNTSSQHSTNSSSGSSIGIGFAFGGTQSGFTLDLAANKARGNSDGDDVTYTNTHVNAGGGVTVVSGGDTTLKGGVIAADSVQAHVGGDLNIESLQDSSTFNSKQTSSGFNMSLCIPPFCYGASSVGGSISKSKAEGDFLSVMEQSGIKAGDGGFQLNVAGNTDLKGGAHRLKATSNNAVWPV